jgi:hypothetical protein
LKITQTAKQRSQQRIDFAEATLRIVANDRGHLRGCGSTSHQQQQSEWVN